MEPKINITLQTPVRDIMAAYPWLKDEAVKIDERFKLLDSPLVKLLIQKATVADAGKYAGFPPETIIAEIGKMVAQHGE